MTPEKDEKKAAELAVLIKESMGRYNTPAYRELTLCLAIETRTKYLAFVQAGFTDQQAIQLAKP